MKCDPLHAVRPSRRQVNLPFCFGKNAAFWALVSFYVGDTEQILNSHPIKGVGGAKMGDALHLLSHPPLTASLERRRIFAFTFIVVLHFNGHLRLLVVFFFLLEGDVHVIYLNASLRRG